MESWANMVLWWAFLAKSPEGFDCFFNIFKLSLISWVPDLAAVYEYRGNIYTYIVNSRVSVQG